jgi:uncharacterized membrane protein YozB (DUF420 family)
LVGELLLVAEHLGLPVSSQGGTVWIAARGNFTWHPRIARWALPVWPACAYLNLNRIWS